MAAAPTVVEITGRSSDKTANELGLVRRFLVTNITIDGGPFAALNAVDGGTMLAVPSIGAPYPGVPSAIVQSKSPESVEGSFYDFIVTVNYTTRSTDPSWDVPPLARPWEFDWDSIYESKAIEQEISESPLVEGRAIVNSVGMPYDPPYEISIPRTTLSVTRNEVSYNSATAREYMGKMNSDVFMGYEPFTARCEKISGRRFFEQNAYWWSVSYNFLFRPLVRLKRGLTTELWPDFNLNVPDNGRYQLNAAGNNTVPILDENSNPVSDTRMLNGVGYAVPVGSAAFYYFSYSVTKAVPFAAFGIS